MATACTPATALSLPRLPATSASASARCLGLTRLPRRSSAAPLAASFNQFTELSQRCSFKTRAASSEETSLDATELFEDLKAKWDATENKTTVIVYGGGAVVALWLSTVVVGAINTVPLLPKIMELVGLGYTGWFVYRYLLFKSSRKELAADIESLKKKIAGTE